MRKIFLSNRVWKLAGNQKKKVVPGNRIHDDNLYL
jgi:hypothetical protein